MSQISIKWHRQLGLAVLLCILGAATYWLEYKHKPDQEQAEEQVKKVFSLKGVEVQEIQLTTPKPQNPMIPIC